jgi:acetolactate synthase-1/2/3 large subunit
MNGGDRIAGVLERQGVRHLFTLCGGHISPILVGARKLGIEVIDVRDEVSAVFAADAVGRLTGVPGVAAVTAGPGVTNTITAVKNAQLAQSPVLILGGATGTILKGRGSLQDIDQQALFAPHVKWQASAGRVRELAPLVEEALWRAREGVPGPVFVECPVDLLYEEALVRQLYGAQSGAPKSLGARALQAYLRFHVSRLFAGSEASPPAAANPPQPDVAEAAELKRARRLLAVAQRPVLMVGSQATLEPPAIEELAKAVEALGLPVYLSGMARGLLGKGHRLQMRHKRRRALKAADLVILAGVPCDFRLDYGRQIAASARVIAVNRSRAEAIKNRRPTLVVEADPGRFLRRLAETGPGSADPFWLESLRGRDDGREAEIAQQSATETEYLNPLALCRAIDRALDDDSVLVADGGDFVATASYTTAPRRPLSWLDPGAFGTLGVGGGFALGARLCRPEAEVWLLWGDGSAAYSLAEFDTFVRHGLGVIAVVGNDASWAQIAREQVEILEDDVGTVLRRTDYHRVAEGYGGVGFKIERPEEIDRILAAAKAEARKGRPVLINALLGKTDFRKGSISM